MVCYQLIGKRHHHPYLGEISLLSRNYISGKLCLTEILKSLNLNEFSQMVKLALDDMPFPLKGCQVCFELDQLCVH